MSNKRKRDEDDDVGNDKKKSNTDNIDTKVYKKLFEFPLQMVMVGRTRSGKSYLLRERIIPSIISEYKDVMVFTPTAALDDGWKKLKAKYKKKIHLFPEFESDKVTEFIRLHGEAKEEGSKDKTMVIFDDVTNRLTQSNDSYFSKLSIFARHYNLSYIVTSHKFRALNTLMRNNATTKIFFKVNSNPEMNAIKEELGTANVSPDNLEDAIRGNTGKYKAFMIQVGPDDDAYYRIEASGKIVLLEVRDSDVESDDSEDDDVDDDVDIKKIFKK